MISIGNRDYQLGAIVEHPREGKNCLQITTLQDKGKDKEYR